MNQPGSPRGEGAHALSLMRGCLWFFLVVPSLLFSETKNTSDLLQQANDKKLASHAYWLRLLHVRSHLDGFHSTVDDPSFFLSKEGGKRPDQELTETLNAFTQPSRLAVDGQPMACRYPARWAWLNEQLHLEDVVSKPVCTRFDEWQKNLRTKSVSVVFASYFLNNPASMYGHTFLKLNQERTPPLPLLDYTVNFAAETNTTNGVVFAWKGLIGGFRGKFSTVPYYVKVQEYNQRESRDLWEYELNLSSDAVTRLVNHLWELGPSSIAYYFFNKNCSYQLLPLLEVAEPTLSLSEPFVWRAVPVDTLKTIVHTPGMLKAIHYRAAHIKRMQAHRALLTEDQQKIAKRIAQVAGKPDQVFSLPIEPQQKAVLLEAAHDLFRYQKGFALELPAPIQAYEQQLLSLRSELGVTSPDIEMGLRKNAYPPDEAHGTLRLDVGMGWTSKTRFQEFHFRGGAHDDLEDPTGYLPGSHLEMTKGTIRYDSTLKKVYLESFRAVDILSLHPYDSWVPSPSWKVYFGAGTAHDLPKSPEKTLHGQLRVGSGLATEIPWVNWGLAFAMAEVDAGVAPVFANNHRIGGGGSAGVQMRVTSNIRAIASISYLKYFLGNRTDRVTLEAGASWRVHRLWELRTTAKRDAAHKEIVARIGYYWDVSR